MPGNSVSNYVCTHLHVLPVLHLLIHGIPKDLPVRKTIDTSVDEAFIVNQNISYFYVHNETPDVALLHDIRLNLERQEYHLIVIVNHNHINDSGTSSSGTTVQSTSVQQSSRLLSLNHTDGVKVLPQGTNDHLVAKAGETYTLIHLFDRKEMMTTQVRESIHLSLPFDTNPLSKQHAATLEALTSDTIIGAPDAETNLIVTTDKNEENQMPVSNVGIVQISPVHRIDTIIADFNESRNYTSMESGEEETTKAEVQRMELTSSIP